MTLPLSRAVAYLLLTAKKTAPAREKTAFTAFFIISMSHM